MKIFSRNADISTELVIDWLRFYGIQEIQRINSDFLLPDSNIPFSFNLNESMQTKDCWVRNWNKTKIETNDIISQDLAHCLESDSLSVQDYIWFLNGIESDFISEKSKLIQLKVAKETGFSIPSTLVTNSKNKLRDFVQEYSKVITKPLSKPFVEIDKIDKKAKLSYTRLINNAEINELPELFYPSLFQEQIKKEFEVRSFIWEEQIWSMAIFSQSSSSTSVDFRNYDQNKPNRRIPYTLPNDISDLVKKYSKTLGIKSGSFDFAVDANDKHFFFEVNAFGQFNMISKSCNYNIEEFIAKTFAL